MIPRIKLANLPTPIEAMPRLGAFLGGNRLWIKRDDLTGVGLGGNKIRKLEYLLAEAKANGAKTLITTGAAQSNHCRQTSALAAKYGMKCKLVLTGEAIEPIDGNLILDKVFGAEIIWAKNTARNSVLMEVFNQAWKAGERPYLIPLGGSTPVGTVGYLRAFQEFQEQNCKVDWIVLASSSGGTQAGLELGKRLTNWKGKILGINVGSEEPDLVQKITNLCTEAADREAIHVECNANEIILNKDYCASGYGNPTGLELEAIHLFASNEGILLDPVYTARAAAALIDLIRKDFFNPNDSILFWHTGGTPAIFLEKYSSILREYL